MHGTKMNVCRAAFLLLLVPQFLSSPVDNFLDRCLKGHGTHKTKPSPEPGLNGRCYPYHENACCTPDTTIQLNTQNVWVNFTWDHCPGHTLTDTCKRHFIDDNCFYECSPNMAPWIVKDTLSKKRDERFMHAPLCHRECVSWWNDCTEEYTCLKNWGRGFNWTTGMNTCPVNSTCRKFSEIFTNATDFCETIWNFSWHVVDDSQPCLVLQFNHSSPNPNTAVARLYAERILNSSLGLRATPAAVIAALSLYLFLKSDGLHG